MDIKKKLKGVYERKVEKKWITRKMTQVINVTKIGLDFNKILELTILHLLGLKVEKT